MLCEMFVQTHLDSYRYALWHVLAYEPIHAAYYNEGFGTIQLFADDLPIVPMIRTIIRNRYVVQSMTFQSNNQEFCDKPCYCFQRVYALI